MKTIKAKVHRLPTENNSHIHLDDFNFLHYSVDKTKLRSDVDTQHLYITTDEEIKEGDWCYDIIGNDVYQWKKSDWDLERDAYEARENSRKIIATTDPELIISISKSMNKDKFPDITLPQISQSFIEEYCKAGGIDEVLVEYELNQKRINPPIQLKLNPDNTIIIHPVEEKMYSREEVINLIERFNKERCGQPWFEDDDKWIEKNL